MAMTKAQREKLTDRELLVKIMEESGEVVQAAAKFYRHGPKARMAGVDYDNTEDLLEEFRQLRGFVMELGKRFQRKPSRTKRRIRKRAPSPVRTAATLTAAKQRICAAGRNRMVARS